MKLGEDDEDGEQNCDEKEPNGEVTRTTFLITGSTDGIGLLTAKMLAKTAPEIKEDGKRRRIFIHGRSKDRIEKARKEILSFAKEKQEYFELHSFCYDLSDFDQVKAFKADLISTFDPEKSRPLDCLINNAAIFEPNGRKKSADGRFERTFMVNVLAPFYLTSKVLEAGIEPNRIIITSSISHSDCYHHLKKLDYDNLQFEKGGWSNFDSYGLSKLLVLMMSRGIYHSGALPASTTLINMDPGTVNTKMLLAGWGHCGIDVNKATNTFQLATGDEYDNQGSLPKYYVRLNESSPTA